MLNFYDYIANSKYYKTFNVNGLLVVEYKCLITEDRVPFWTHENYFAYILSGKKIYASGKNEYFVQNGDAIFVRKGAYLSESRGAGEYCALILFASDDFIQRVVDKYSTIRHSRTPDEKYNSIFPLHIDESLATYFHSVLSYFSKEEAPSNELLKVKFEELLLNIFNSEHHQSLASCLGNIRDNGKVSLREVMESSFMYPMSLDEYARLCARSLSAFKTDFYAIYKTSPGKWLIDVRIQYAKILLETTEDSVGEIAFKSGFKNTAHFVKVFKNTFGTPPLQYRLKEANINPVDKMAVL